MPPGRDMPDLSLGPEWAALEVLTVGDAAASARAIPVLLQHAEFHWGELLEQALRHQMLPLVAREVLELAESVGVRVPGRVAQHLAEVLETNRWRLTVFRREAARIGAALRARGIPFVGTKGITFESTIYRGAGVRMLKDLDFMIAPMEREPVFQLLAELGYRPGNYDRLTGAIVPLPRKMEVTYALNPDHLPRHARLAPDPVVPYLYVDFANSLTWSRSPYEVPVEEALRHRVELPLAGCDSETLPAFRTDYQFLFTVLHLFREAWMEQWLEQELDVSLMKFGDIIRLFRTHAEELSGGRYAALLDSLGVAEPVAWVLEHTDRTFGTGMIAALGLGGRVSDKWLATAHPSSGQEREWRGSMRERLWARNREVLFARGPRKATSV
jgi:hypothetical protein